MLLCGEWCKPTDKGIAKVIRVINLKLLIGLRIHKKVHYQKDATSSTQKSYDTFHRMCPSCSNNEMCHCVSLESIFVHSLIRCAKKLIT